MKTPKPTASDAVPMRTRPSGRLSPLTRWLAAGTALCIALGALGCRDEAPAPKPATVFAPAPKAPTEGAGAKSSTVPPTAGATPILEQRKRYSQFKEELVIRDFFQDRRDGFFLDVGCAWPVRNSTTYYLEKHLGWSGFGVDAVPDYGPAWAEQRPGSKFFSFLVSDKADAVETFYKADWSGVSSIEKGRVFKGKEVRTTEVQLQTITLNRLLDDHKVEKIDFMSMDIEGAEPKALAGFDIERFKPELVCIEASPSIRPHLLEYFAAHNYERIDKYLKYDFINWYFKPREARKAATTGDGNGG